MPDVCVRLASMADRPVLERLWLMFRHDMSECRGQLPNPDGTFRNERLLAAFEDPGWAPYLLISGERPAGLAFVRGLDGPTRILNSFFVVRGARRTGIGLHAAQDLLSRHPGRWEIAFQDGQRGRRAVLAPSRRTARRRRLDRGTPPGTGSARSAARRLDFLRRALNPYSSVMGTRSAMVQSSDGREICYEIGGDPRGYPVIGLHGTPGCRLSRWTDSAYAEAGVRYVTPDRAGYGQSTRHRGRTVADDAQDVLAVADALGFERFGVTGGSGGGPHVLACAALLPDRIERAACLVGLAPLGAGGLDRATWLAGMDPGNARELDWADAGEEVLVRELTREQQRLAEQLAADPAAMFGDELSDADRGFLELPETIETFTRIIPEQAAHGVFGWVDDTLAFAAPWAFKPELIEIPVLLAYGLEDVLVPPAHGRWLTANIPAATTVVNPSGGHLPSDPVADIVATMAWLRFGVVPDRL